MNAHSQFQDHTPYSAPFEQIGHLNIDHAEDCVDLSSGNTRFSAKRNGLGFSSALLRDTYSLYSLGTAPREALWLMNASPDTTLGRFVSGRGRIRSLAVQPFVSAEWSSSTRMRRMMDHCAIVDALGHPFDIHGAQYVEVAHFRLGEDDCRLTLDRPKWLENDGMLCASLWAGPDRIFSVSFCLSTSSTGRTAFIGGLQGRKSLDALDQNRLLTKAAHGLRPRDLAIELFRMLAPYMHVTHIEGVADASRYQLTRRAILPKGLSDKVLLDYDEIWESRGGTRGADGFFAIPVANPRRDINELPSKKRSMYKRRYDLLDLIEHQVASSFRTGTRIHNHLF